MQVLRRAVPGSRGWIWIRLSRLLRLEARVAAAVAAVTTIAVLWVANRSRPAEPLGLEPAACLESFAAERWHAASVLCAREAERTGAAAVGVRAAGALIKLGRLEEARAAAPQWFGSSDDATARQVAGEAYLRLGEAQQALPLLYHARSGHLLRGDHAGAADDEKLIAGALQRSGRLEDALDAAEAAVRYADLATGSAADRRRRGRTRLVLGKILIEIGDFDRARTTLWSAQPVLADSPGDQTWVCLQLAMLVQAEGDLPGAAVLFEQALEYAVKADVPQVATAAHLNLARVRCELGDLEAAEMHWRQVDPNERNKSTARLVEALIAAGRGHRGRAEQVLGDIAAHSPTPDYAIDISLQRGRLAEGAADLVVAEQHYRAAIAVVEKLRSNTESLELRPWILASRRVPHRMLLALLIRQGRHLEALVIAEHLHARTWLDALVGRTVRATPASDPREAPVRGTGLRAHLSSALELGRRLQADARNPLSADQLVTLLREREVLVFAELDADIWRFHIINGEIVRLDRLPEGIRTLAERWSKDLNHLSLAAELGELLIPPAARAPSPRPLYIVSNGALGHLPFAALRPGNRYLVEDRILARLPGIVALRCRPGRELRQASVFLGDSRNDLPHARQEAMTLARSLSGDAFVGEHATVAQLEASRSVALLHLAVHAEGDRAGARLLFAEHTQVTLAQIVAHRIGPRVAVLAGCATAAAQDTEGWNDLASAFLVAGSRSVVGTLRSVADRDAKALMHWFYAFDGARQPALALARAQRRLLRESPYAWALFVVHGSAVASDCGR